MSRIEYDKINTIEDNSNLTVLETSLAHGISHMHACGGNARCSTCRFLVLENPENLSPINEAERKLILERGFEKNIRLGCQAKILSDVKIRLLVNDNADFEDVRLRKTSTTGREDNLAILFSDIRNFTNFSEKHLPYDIIHILNRYFEKMGQIVLNNGGYLDKYIGDGLMANFGLKQTDPISICLRAIDAALKMITALKEINLYAKQQLDHEFKIGIGIHYGDVIVGELGHHSNAAFTLIGDAVNQASRVESMTKKAGVEILISETVYQYVKDYIKVGKHFKAPLKGKSGEFHLFEVLDIDNDIVKKYLTSGNELILKQIIESTKETFSIIFEKPSNFQFKPGQFVDLTLKVVNSEGSKLDESRSFSIASAPEENELRFVTRNTKSNFKKEIISLSPGAKVHISEPTGYLFLRPEPKRKHVFLASGIGVTPFYSIIRHEYDTATEKNLVLYVSGKNLDSLVYHKEFIDLDSKDIGFTYCPTLTKEIPSDWSKNFERGRIDKDFINRKIKNLHECIFYLAGSEDFVSSAKDSLNQLGVVPARIVHEVFYGY